jgi:peptide/nickel transport system permease protein/glutathione transport system permease protein
MIFYIVRRLLAAVPTLWAVLTLVFVLVRIVPGDPAIAILGDRATPDAVAALQAKLGLDRPIWEQYVSFMGQSLRGDFGVSMVTNRPILADVGAVIPHTIDLTLAALLIGVVVGVPAGVWAALHRNRWEDIAARMLHLMVHLEREIAMQGRLLAGFLHVRMERRVAAVRLQLRVLPDAFRQRKQLRKDVLGDRLRVQARRIRDAHTPVEQGPEDWMLDTRRRRLHPGERRRRQNT